MACCHPALSSWPPPEQTTGVTTGDTQALKYFSLAYMEIVLSYNMQQFACIVFVLLVTCGKRNPFILGIFALDSPPKSLYETVLCQKRPWWLGLVCPYQRCKSCRAERRRLFLTPRGNCRRSSTCHGFHNSPLPPLRCMQIHQENDSVSQTEFGVGVSYHVFVL